MMTYWKLLENIPGSKLKLTRIDDEISEAFKEAFPDFDPASTIDEDEMKSKKGKEQWRNFINQYEKKVDDYNFGTMLRKSPKTEYDEKDTIFGRSTSFLFGRGQSADHFAAVRMQFYAVEIARNRAGLNDWIYEQNHPSESK